MRQILLNVINKLIKKIREKNRKRKLPYPLYLVFDDLFRRHGEGLYIVCLKASPDNFVSKIIGMITGQMAHTFIMLYSQTFGKWLTMEQTAKVTRSIINNYKVPPQNIKALVISSADSTGMECFDFSSYQNRKMTIRKIPASKDQLKKIISFLVDIVGRPYDFTGLLGWLFKCGDDAQSYYCSEAVYDACKSAGIIVADNSSPSVDDIENFSETQSWKIFKNFGVPF